MQRYPTLTKYCISKLKTNHYLLGIWWWICQLTLSLRVDSLLHPRYCHKTSQGIMFQRIYFIRTVFRRDFYLNCKDSLFYRSATRGRGSQWKNIYEKSSLRDPQCYSISSRPFWAVFSMSRNALPPPHTAFYNAPTTFSRQLSCDASSMKNTRCLGRIFSPWDPASGLRSFQ